MYVNHSGWNIETGPFNYNIYVDENKTDHEIHFQDGTIAKQVTPFESRTEDWNHDGDVYEQFGAWFQRPGENRSTFWTPEELVMSIIETMEENRSPYGPKVAFVKGIDVPAKDKRPTLEDKILQSERRLEAQEIERNRRMEALGIRPPNEPWAR